MPLPSRRRTYLLVLLTFLFVIGLNYLGWLDWLKYRLRIFFIPILTTANQVGVKVGENYRFFSNKNEFFDSYNSCLINLQGKEAIEAKDKLLEEENAELKKQLNFVRHNNFKTVTANVVGRNADSIEKTIIVNAGSTDGVKVGHPVIAGEGVLIGIITKVDPEISVVRLIDDNQSKVLATVLNKDRSLGVVEAGYGNSVRMNFIPRNEIILIGDQIITSGQVTSIPKGLLIGTVVAIENEAYNPFQQATINTTVDLGKIVDVTVLLTF